MKSSLLRRRLWWFLVIALAGGIAPTRSYARVRHSDAWAREHFAAAERMREALNGRPLTERTRHDYQRVLNAYRLVYRGSPSSSKADPSVVAVAETLVEMGRRFEDQKILHEAIDEYRLLRREYPGSRYRFDALFTIAEIYQDDLNDPAAARTAFQDFLRRYPHNRLSDDARDAIVALDHPKESAANEKSEKAAAKRSERNLGRSEREATVASSANDAPAEHVRAAQLEASATANAEDGANARPASPGHISRVTGIRHWSTPGYTRVAIDIENNVKFSSQRIGNPARIYFDLQDTRLASTLLGKTFDVDDSFLKKVRVAQFSPRRTRIVLEVENLSGYNAFLIPNPSRLIIDIRGKNDYAATGASRRPGAERQLSKADPREQKNESDDSASADVNSTAAEVDGPNLDGTNLDGTNLDRPNVDRTKTYSTATQESGDATPSTTTSSGADPGVVNKTVENGVVKTVVEADGENANTTPVEAKKTTRVLNSAISKKSHTKNFDSTIENSESASSEADSANATRNSAASKRKNSSRTLASSDHPSLDFSVREAVPTVNGDRSLIRALGLKIGKIVIDPGHGGHDTGTIGPNGLEEKDLVLDVSRRLGKMLESRLGAEVVYTRKDDTFIPLETRTAIANQARADLFVSVHANSSHDPDARGVETYYLNFTSSPEALEVAARENAVSETSIYELQDLVKKIALKEKIEESREFAWDVQQSLHTGLAAKVPAIRDRGVKKAPFIVLIGANMPSILAEISFVSNPSDERRLSTIEYRQRIAESLYRGIAKYVNGLSGIKVASKMEKTVGQ